MTLKGPFLRLEANKPLSWIVIEVKDGKAPQFYEKSLEEDARYRPLEVHENDIIYAIGNYAIGGKSQKFMWKRLGDEYYEVQPLGYKNSVINLKNDRHHLKRDIIPKEMPTPKFDEITYVLSSSEEEYYRSSTEQLKQELNSQEIQAPLVRKDYSLKTLTLGMELTETQEAVKEQLAEFWFFNDIQEEYVADACRIIFCQKPINHQVESNLDSAPTLFRQEFCWPENIVKNFQPNVRISDVIEFTYFLVNKVYELHTNGEKLPKPTLPVSSNQTVEQFSNSPQNDNPAGENIVENFDVDPALQNAILASFSPPNALNPQQHEEVPILDIFANYDELKTYIHNDLYPPAQLSWIGRWCEWICHLCRILDIYCLRITNVAKTISEHQVLPEEKKMNYNQKFFSSEGDFDDNIRDLYVSQLWKGRG